MKLSSLVLAMSLAANGAVAAFYFIRQPSLASTSDSRGSLSSTATEATKGSSPHPAHAAQTAALAAARAQLQSGDLPSFVAQLRAAGFSATMIRSIVAAQLNEQFVPQRKAILAAQPERTYWKAQIGSLIDPKGQAALRNLNKEQTALFKSLLGADAQPIGEEAQFYQRAQYGNIPREKIEQVQAVISDYNEISQDVYAKTSGTIQLQEDREKLALIEKEKLADLAKILTPQELEDYQMRSSGTATQLRFNLSSFNPSEDEFRAVYRAATVVEAQLGPQSNVRTSDDMRKRQEALIAQLQSSLPPERLAELKVATDPEYQTVNRLVARLELPPATSHTVVTLQKDIQQRAAALRNDRALAPDARNAQLAALADEATTKLTTTLTSRGFEAYKTYGGFWLQNLVPPPPRPAPPK